MGSHATAAHCLRQDASDPGHYLGPSKHSEAEHCGLWPPKQLPKDAALLVNSCYPHLPSVSMGQGSLSRDSRSYLWEFPAIQR